MKEPLDREVTDSYALTVLASDGKFEAQVVVEVTVLDINDNPPLCQQVSSVEKTLQCSVELIPKKIRVNHFPKSKKKTILQLK